MSQFLFILLKIYFVYVYFIFLQFKLFEGLEEDLGLSSDIFVFRKNIKKFVLKFRLGREVRMIIDVINCLIVNVLEIL